MAGRPQPRKLEQEVFARFRQWDLKYSMALRDEYPHLVKPAPPVGSSGMGSVKWVGLNPDPCKAKFMEKQGIGRSSSVPSLKRQRPASAPSGSVGRDRTVRLEQAPKAAKDIDLGISDASTSAEGTRSRPQSASRLARSSSTPAGLQQGRRSRPASAPAGRVHRDLSGMSASVHYLEQKLKLDTILPPEAYGPGGAWPAPCTKKPDDLMELLYSGTSKDGSNGQGRVAYLRARRTMAPQEKTSTPLTNSQDVGWQHSVGKPAKILLPVRGSGAKCVCPG